GATRRSGKRGEWRLTPTPVGGVAVPTVSLDLSQQSLCFLLRQTASNHPLRYLPLAIKLVAFGKLTAMRVLAEMTLYSRRVPPNARRVPPMMGGQHEQVPAYSMCMRTTFIACIRRGEITGAAASRGKQPDRSSEDGPDTCRCFWHKPADRLFLRSQPRLLR